MAKKKPTSDTAAAKKAPVKLTARDKKTNDSLVGLADKVVSAAKNRKDPYVEIPSRTLANVHYSPRKKILEMGNAKNRRQLFDLSQAKAYMRTMLVASGCKKLLTCRQDDELARYVLHAQAPIEGSTENTFDDQNESDPVIEDLEVLLGSIREELHLYAESRRQHGRSHHLD